MYTLLGMWFFVKLFRICEVNLRFCVWMVSSLYYWVMNYWWKLKGFMRFLVTYMWRWSMMLWRWVEIWFFSWVVFLSIYLNWMVLFGFWIWSILVDFWLFETIWVLCVWNFLSFRLLVLVLGCWYWRMVVVFIWMIMMGWSICICCNWSGLYLLWTLTKTIVFFFLICWVWFLLVIIWMCSIILVWLRVWWTNWWCRYRWVRVLVVLSMWVETTMCACVMWWLILWLCVWRKSLVKGWLYTEMLGFLYDGSYVRVCG